MSISPQPHMILSIFLAVIFIALAVIFLLGKGDGLIAGFNTLNEKERGEIDLGRLRLLMAIIAFLSAGLCFSLPYIGNNQKLSLLVTGIFVAVCILVVVLANTWAKKK